MAPPTYEDGLVLAATHMLHDNMSREAVCAYAIFSDAAVDAGAWANALQGAFADNFKSVLDSEVVITRTLTLKGDGTDVFTTGESTTAGVRGLRAGSSLPANCAVLGKKLTAFGGRKNRGRMYLPWTVVESHVDEMGGIDTGDIADNQAAFDGWLEDINGFTTTQLAIANREYDRPWDVPGRRLVSVSHSGPVTAITVERTIATQRRRMPRS